MDPVHALKKGSYQALSADEGRLRTILAAGFAVLSLMCLTVARSRPIFYGGYAFAIIALR